MINFNCVGNNVGYDKNYDIFEMSQVPDDVLNSQYFYRRRYEKRQNSSSLKL